MAERKEGMGSKHASKGAGASGSRGSWKASQEPGDLSWGGAAGGIKMCRLLGKVKMSVISERKCNDCVVGNAQDYSSKYNMGKTNVFMGFSLNEPVAWTRVSRAGKVAKQSHVSSALRWPPAMPGSAPGFGHQLPLLHLDTCPPNGTSTTMQQTELLRKWHCLPLLTCSTLSPPTWAQEQPRNISCQLGTGCCDTGV